MKQIRSSKFSKLVAYYLAVMMFLQITQPTKMYALTEGPSQPEFNSFTPIGTSDMVDLASGDFNYNIPVMDVGGYPINLAYNSGVTMDQEASWVGLGWNLNIGQINRNVRGLPDDFKGDIIKTESNLKDNLTVGSSFYVNPQLVGALDFLKLGAGLEVQYNNYKGYSAVPSYGVSFQLNNTVTVGMQLSSSTETGATITPNVSLSFKEKEANKKGGMYSFGLSPSISYNSRQGLSSFNINAGISYLNGKKDKTENGGGNKSTSLRGGSGSISFVNNTFTPTKRMGLKNNGCTFSFSGGPDLWGFHGELSFTGYGTLQSLIQKSRDDKSYGYENTHLANENDLLDFNREKEQSQVSKNTLVLPVTNYTYDIYSVQGQSVGGMFRSYRGQVGYVYEPKTSDISTNMSMGAEYEGGAGGHIGGNIKRMYSNTFTTKWNAPAVSFFNEQTSNNNILYENVYFKNIGENRIDQEYQAMYEDRLGGDRAITLGLDANRQATNRYLVNSGSQSNIPSFSNTPISFIGKIKRNSRENRNQAIQKITKQEANNFGLTNFININSNAEEHHTAGYIITDESGSRHVFGETAYNKLKKEVTFATGVTSSSNGIIDYETGDNTSGNTKGLDHYFNSITTPEYAHTYLLTSVLSSDYEDLTGNGITDDDLGSYTKFIYSTIDDYKWRVPFKEESASFNEGMRANSKDNKASYIYGTKELKYVTKIVTKTHVAFIDLEDRKDGVGAYGEKGGMGSDRMKKIKSIRLYSKAQLNGENDPGISSNITPIKTAHFIYDYSLCEKIDNNNNSNQLTGNELSNGGGKLTLKKVYFTYGESNMGKYTPYIFHYDNENPNYNAKAYDIWGNYKPYSTSSGLAPQDFPYVEQDNQELQNDYASAWSLSSIDLPSGGKINLTYEADDYQFVQDKRALQMFKVKGVCKTQEGAVTTSLYTGNGSYQADYVVVQVNEEDENSPNSTIIDKYIGELSGKSIYFNFFMQVAPKNNSSGTKDFVPGYFEMDGEAIVRVDQVDSSKKELLIPMKHLNKEGRNSSSDLINPITLTGLFYGRNNMPNYLMFGGNPPSPSFTNIFNIGKSLVNNLVDMINIFRGPNELLMNDGSCQSFEPEKSWIRLQEPSGSKIGGGSRVKTIEMYDNWNEMVGVSETSPDIERYKKVYGQEYSYELDNGTSSGVATYEPNICKENPLIEPFYHTPEKRAAQAYEETPFGESFYPNPTVTYSKVSVKNITAADDDGTEIERKTKSGVVNTYHYTSYDFPTKSEFTSLDNPLTKFHSSNENEIFGNIIKGIFGAKINVNINLHMTQGFAIETNDMNGKMKKQEVLNNAGDLISKVEYKYNVDQQDPSRLNSNLTTINNVGVVNNNFALGMHYDVINDFRESYAYSEVKGVSGNVDYIPIPLFGIVLGFGVPELSEHQQVLKTAVTTKVTHRTGILVEKIAYDLGSRVSTRNLAWDANTGQVLLTETVNEFDDVYYSFNYPAYWFYTNMGMASSNLNTSGSLQEIQNSGNAFFTVNNTGNTTINEIFTLGDELIVKDNINFRKFWVADINNNSIRLMKTNGQFIQPNELNGNIFFRIIRSGRKNLQMASMASITLQANPLSINNNGTGSLNQELINFAVGETNPFIVNASAVEYSDDWSSQCETVLPNAFGMLNGQLGPVNPYLYNTRGEWRAKKSFAYLTGRDSNTTTRNSGFYKQFSPYYQLNGNNWIIDPTNWTFASEVSMYNPYGMELENRDALNRYSSAQYGYNYTLPVAVSSNAKYQEIGFDNFEDYTNTNGNPHFGFNASITLGNNDVGITTKKSHTGKKAMVVKANKTAEYKKRVKQCDTNNQSQN